MLVFHSQVQLTWRQEGRSEPQWWCPGRRGWSQRPSPFSGGELQGDKRQRYQQFWSCWSLCKRNVWKQLKICINNSSLQTLRYYTKILAYIKTLAQWQWLAHAHTRYCATGQCSPIPKNLESSMDNHILFSRWANLCVYSNQLGMKLGSKLQIDRTYFR